MGVGACRFASFGVVGSGSTVGGVGSAGEFATLRNWEGWTKAWAAVSGEDAESELEDPFRDSGKEIGEGTAPAVQPEGDTAEVETVEKDGMVRP